MPPSDFQQVTVIFPVMIRIFYLLAMGKRYLHWLITFRAVRANRVPACFPILQTPITITPKSITYPVLSAGMVLPALWARINGEPFTPFLQGGIWKRKNL